MSTLHRISLCIYFSFIIINATLQWQISSILPTDLVGAQIGIYDNNLHLINGVYNATKLNYSSDNNNLVLWLTMNLTKTITMTQSQPSFTINPTSWDITTDSLSSLGSFLCYSKCSAQIDKFLYVISPEQIDDGQPNGLLIVYNLESKQLIPLGNTPYYLNGDTCVVHNNTHLFTIGGYNTQCPTNTFDQRCDDPQNILIYDTTTRSWYFFFYF